MQAVLLWILIPGHTSASLQYQKHCTYRVFFLILYCQSSAIALAVRMQAVLLWILIPGQTSAFLELQKYRTGCPLDVALSKLYCNIDISLSARMKAVLLWILIQGHTSDFFLQLQKYRYGRPPGCCTIKVVLQYSFLIGSRDARSFTLDSYSRSRTSHIYVDTGI